MSSLKSTLQAPEQIAYFLSANTYCWLHFRHGEKKLLAKPISYIQAQLPAFVRVHKTVLVNPSYIKSLHQPPHKKMLGKVYMETGDVFPVSWQRLPAVLERLQALSTLTNAQQALSEVPTPPLGAGQPSVVLVSGDREQALRIEYLIDRAWSAYQLKAVEQGNYLVEVLNQSAEADYPVLILLDAHTKTVERMRLLRGLKESPALRQIPVVLFVPPGDPLLVKGYDCQANSVVVVPSGYAIPEEVIGRVLHYWLDVAALSNPGRNQV